MKIVTSDNYDKGIPLEIPSWVSCNHVKCYKYGQEPYFQEAFYQLSSANITMTELQTFSYVLVKPDGFPTRCIERLLKALHECEFSIIFSKRLRFNRYTIRELWRYEYNLATLERYRLLDELLAAGDSLFLLVRDNSGLNDASTRLSRLKGKSNPSLRSGGSIRNLIDARSGNLNHIHTPDEFIDFARELGVLLDRKSVV